MENSGTKSAKALYRDALTPRKNSQDAESDKPKAKLSDTVNEFKDKYFSNVIGPHLEAMKKLEQEGGLGCACKEYALLLKDLQSLTEMYGNGDLQNAISKLVLANGSVPSKGGARSNFETDSMGGFGGGDDPT